MSETPKKRRKLPPPPKRGNGTVTPASTSERTKADIERRYNDKQAEIDARSVGKPSKVRLDELRLIQYLTRCGRTMTFIHQQLLMLREENGEPSFSYETLSEWQQRYPEYFSKVSDWKAQADAEVEASLWELATGKTVSKHYVKHEMKADKDGEDKYTKTRDELTRQEIPPNFYAIEFWLANRRPDQWKRRQEMDVALKDLAKLSDAELLAKAKEAIENMTKTTNNTQPEK